MDFHTELADRVSGTILKRLEPLHKLLEEFLLERRRPFISLDEASRYLEISKSTLYRYISKELIPGYKVNNRKIYIKIDDLNNFVLDKKNRVTNQDSEME